MNMRVDRHSRKNLPTLLVVICLLIGIYLYCDFLSQTNHELSLRKSKSKVIEHAQLLEDEDTKVVFSNFTNSLKQDIRNPSPTKVTLQESFSVILNAGSSTTLSVHLQFQSEVLDVAAIVSAFVEHFKISTSQPLAVISPAVDTIDDNTLFVVFRVTFEKERLSILSKTKDYHVNQAIVDAVDSHIVSSQYHINTNTFHDIKILPIPAIHISTSGDGPQDPRLLRFRSNFYIYFSMPRLRDDGSLFETVYVFDVKSGALITPSLHMTNSQFKPRVRDKNWSFFALHDRLYCVYNLEPLVILECDKTFMCTQTSSTDLLAIQGNIDFILRGGTNLVQMNDDLFISFAHSVYTLKQKGNRKVYFTHLVIVDAFKREKVLAVSSPLKIFPDVVMKTCTTRRPWVTAAPFFFPISLTRNASDGSLILSGHINDCFSAIVMFEEADLMEIVKKVQGGANHGKVDFHSVVKDMFVAAGW